MHSRFLQGSQQVMEHCCLHQRAVPVCHNLPFIRCHEGIFRDICASHPGRQPRQVVHDTFPMDVLVTCAAAHDQTAPCCHILFQQLHALPCQDAGMWIEEHLVLFQPLQGQAVLCMFCGSSIFHTLQVYIVKRHMLQLHGGKQRPLACVLHTAMPPVQPGIPDIVIIP